MKVPGISGAVRSIFGEREFGSRGRGCAEEEDPQRRRDIGGENPDASDGKRADHPKCL